MKFIKVLIGIFAVIGVIVVCLGVGFLFGMKNQTTTSVPDESTITPVVTENLIPESTVTNVPTPTSEPEPTATSVPTPTSTPTPKPTSTPVPTATSTPTPAEYTYRNLNEMKLVNESFNLFSDASGNGSVKCVIDNRYIINVTKQCNETGWYGITANLIDTNIMALIEVKEGFIHPDIYKTLSDYGSHSSDSSNSSLEEKETYTFTDMSVEMVPIGKVNVRDLPSSEGNKLDTISEGKVVMVQGKCNETGWYKIAYYSDNLEAPVYGYADSSYFTEYVKPTATPTPKPTTTPSQNQSSGAFTGTVLVTVGTGKDRHQEEVQATGTKQVNGYTIYENLGEDTYVVLEGSANMKNSKINEVYRAYEAIYGDHIGETVTDNGDVVFIINPTGGEFATGDGIQINTNSTSEAKPTTTPSQNQSSGTFTGTVLVTVGTGNDKHQEEVQATGTKQVNGYTIYENLGEDTYVVLEGSANMKSSQIGKVMKAYEDLYDEHVGYTTTDNGDWVFIINPTGGEIGTGKIQINTNSTSEAKPTTTPSQNQSSGTFTGTVLVTVGTGNDKHQEEVQATGTKQVNGYTIYENLGEDTYVVLEGSANMKNSKINEVYRAYEAIYGDHIGETATDNGDVVFIINPTGGEIGTGKIQINTNSTSEAKPTTTPSQNQSSGTFTGTVLVTVGTGNDKHQEEVQATGTKQVNGYTIYENLGEDTYVVLEGSANMKNSKINEVYIAYEAIYGDHIGETATDNGDVVFIINPTGGEIGTGKIQINTN